MRFRVEQGEGASDAALSLEDTVRGSVRGEIGKDIALALTVDQEPSVAEIGEPEPAKVVEQAGDLFGQQAVA